MTSHNWRHRKSLGFFSQLSSLRGLKGRVDENYGVGRSNTPLSNTRENEEETPSELQSAAIELAPQRTCVSGSVQRKPLGPTPSEPSTIFGDNERTKTRYNQTLKKLEQTLTLRVSSSETSRLLNIDEIRQQDQITYLREQVDKMLVEREARESLRRNSAVLHRIFKAITPISKTLLSIAVQGQPVKPFSLKSLIHLRRLPRMV